MSTTSKHINDPSFINMNNNYITPNITKSSDPNNTTNSCIYSDPISTTNIIISNSPIIVTNNVIIIGAPKLKVTPYPAKIRLYMVTPKPLRVLVTPHKVFLS